MADDNQNDQQVSESTDQQETVANADTADTAETPTTEAEAPVEEAPVVKESAPEPVKEEKAEEPKKAVKPVSKDLEKIIEQIEKLSVIELADLVHALEERFGVSASAPTVAAATSTSSGQAGEAVDEGKTTFNVILTSGGANKISVIKAVRELVPTLGLKEAKDLVEGAPKPVLEGVNKESAEEGKLKLTAAGGTVELQ